MWCLAAAVRPCQSHSPFTGCFLSNVLPAEEGDVLWRARTTKREKQPGPANISRHGNSLSMITNVMCCLFCVLFAQAATSLESLNVAVVFKKLADAVPGWRVPQAGVSFNKQAASQDARSSRRSSPKVSAPACMWCKSPLPCTAAQLALGQSACASSSPPHNARCNPAAKQLQSQDQYI